MNFQTNVPLKNYSNYKIGGIAKFFAEVFSVNDLREAISFAKKQKLKTYILGRGTKVLIGDKGFDGLIIFNRINGIERKGNILKVGSGTLMEDLLNYCIENSLSGLEWAGGLPGTIGGAVRGNSGAFGGEIKDNITSVESIDLNTLVQKTRKNLECKFNYRESIFKTKDARDEFIAFIVLKLKNRNREEIRNKIQEKVSCRESRQPLNFPSLGSTFKNIPFVSLSEELKKEFKLIVKNDPFPVVPVTKILSSCGLKGKRVGGAIISEKHPNFIINMGSATAGDVKTLVEIARKIVKKKYDILLQEEIIYLN